MNYTILHMGECKEPYYKSAFEEFQKRMKAYGTLEAVALRPAKTPGRELSREEIRQTLEKEEEEWMRYLSAPSYKRSYKIALCIEGKELSSPKLAELFDRVASGGQNSIVFLIGSSWGMSDRVKEACDLRLSFSPMTFAHSLFRVMLAEQIYRAAGILAGSQYHK